MSLYLGRWAGAVAAAALTLAGAQAQTADPDLRGAQVSPAAPAEGPADALPELPSADMPNAAAAPPPATGKSAPKRKKGALPPLQPYPRAARAALRGGQDLGDATPAPTVAALPPPPPRRTIKREDNPFDPVGLYVGDLKLTPYIEEDVGYASNPFGAPSAAKGSALSTTEVGVGLQSNWSRNELTGQAKVGYNAYFETPGASAPYGSGVVDYRLDASHDLSFDVEGRYNVATQTNAQLGLGGVQTQSLTLVSTYGATLGGAYTFGRFTLGLHGSLDRTQYDGGSLATDDYDDYGLKLRASYRLSEAIQPFVEAGADARRYDTDVDATGYDRQSTGETGKAGLRVSLSEVLTGEVSGGYGERQYRDARLPDASAPLFDASLIWSATPLTTVTLKTATQLQDAVIAGASANVNRGYTINLDHALTQRIKLGVSGGFSTDDYVGTGQRDHSWTIGASAEYHLSREIVLKASATHQQFVSNLPGANYSSDTVLLGLRLQR